jgi:hypothetical protein
VLLQQPLRRPSPAGPTRCPAVYDAGSAGNGCTVAAAVARIAEAAIGGGAAAPRHGAATPGRALPISNAHTAATGGIEGIAPWAAAARPTRRGAVAPHAAPTRLATERLTVRDAIGRPGNGNSVPRQRRSAETSEYPKSRPTTSLSRKGLRQQIKVSRVHAVPSLAPTDETNIPQFSDGHPTPPEGSEAVPIHETSCESRYLTKRTRNLGLWRMQRAQGALWVSSPGTGQPAPPRGWMPQRGSLGWS